MPLEVLLRLLQQTFIVVSGNLIVIIWGLNVLKILVWHEQLNLVVQILKFVMFP